MDLTQTTSPLPQLIPPAQDPFWHTPTRLPQALTSATVAPSKKTPHAVDMASALPQTQYARRTLQCTHMTMMRVYGSHDCQFCGKIPKHGYLYLCCQDANQAGLTLPAQHIAELSKHIETQSLEAKSYMAEALAMSQSIVRQISTGFYSSNEIELLFAQRRQVIEVLRELMTAEPNHVDVPDATQQQSADITDMEIPQSEREAPAPKAMTVKSPPCNLQVCHNCKPFLRDRLFGQPLTILENESGRWTVQDMELLPIHNANVLKGMILPGEVRPFKPVGEDTTGYHVGTLMSDDTPVSVSSSEYSDTSSDSDAFQFKFSSYGLKTAGRNEAVHDLHLRDATNGRARRASLVHTADQTTPFRPYLQTHVTPGMTESPLSTPSQSPPDSATSPLTPVRHSEEPFEASFEKKVGTFAKSASFCGPFRSSKPSQDHVIMNESLWTHAGNDEHVHINGGLALTEESIQIGIPDCNA